MTWVVFVAGAVLSWGVYGAMLHQGQQQLGNPLKALLCVGMAYFLVGVVVPLVALSSQGSLGGWNSGGTTTATIAGILGAAGAACIIWSFRSGGIPLYVMPLVFGGAPIINVLYSMVIHPAEKRRPTRCSTSASCWRRSAPAWCCTSGRRLSEYRCRSAFAFLRFSFGVRRRTSNELTERSRERRTTTAWIVP